MFVRKDGLGKVEGWLAIPLVVWLTSKNKDESNPFKLSKLED
jgi:hypothetical protein